MIKFALLGMLALVPVMFSVACDDGTQPAPAPRPAARCGTVFDSSISEAQKAEFELKYSALTNQLQGMSIRQKYNHDMKKIAADASGPITQNATALGINPAEFDGRWYQASEYWIEYLGNNKFWIHAKAINDPLHISKEVLVR
jgi:hypothetical protein